MSILFLFFLTSFFAHIFGISTNETRIVSGNLASEGQFPYVISLRTKSKNFHICGGSILNEYWILTAAHCISKRQPKDLIVVTGSIYLNKGGDRHDVLKLIRHKDHTSSIYINDVGLIKLKTPIKFNKNTKPIEIDKNYVEGDLNAVTCGWGQTVYHGHGSKVLKYLETRVISNQNCIKKLFPHFVNELMICIDSGFGSGICLGDSGGPLILNQKQIGITSWTILPCAKGRPDMFTRVSHYYEWIMYQINVN